MARNFACVSTSEAETLKRLPVTKEKKWSLLKYLSIDVNTEGDREEERWMAGVWRESARRSESWEKEEEEEECETRENEEKIKQLQIKGEPGRGGGGSGAGGGGLSLGQRITSF